MSDSPATPAPLWRRLAASVYDLLPAAAVLMAAAAIWIGVGKLVAPASGVESFGHWAIGNWPFRLWLLAALFAYYGLSWRYGGQTLGMRAWRIALRSHAGAAPGWPRLAVRFAIAFVSIGAAGLGLLWPIVDRRKRMWHDLATGTEVVLLQGRRTQRDRRTRAPRTTA